MSKHILFSIKTSKREVWGCLFLSKFAFLDQHQKHLSLHTPPPRPYSDPMCTWVKTQVKECYILGNSSGQCVLGNVFWSMCSGQLFWSISSSESTHSGHLWSAGGREEGCQCQPSFSIVGEIFEIRFKLKHLRQKLPISTHNILNGERF